VGIKFETLITNRLNYIHSQSKHSLAGTREYMNVAGEAKRRRLSPEDNVLMMVLEKKTGIHGTEGKG